MSRITHLVRPNIAALTPYSTARDEYVGHIGIFLDANESPYTNGFNRYPDPHQAALKAKIAPIKGIPAENLFLGNGSDEAIDLVFRIFCVPGKDNAVIMTPSYGMYGVAAAINDIAVRSVQLDRDFALDTEKLLAACDNNTKVMFLCQQSFRQRLFQRTAAGYMRPLQGHSCSGRGIHRLFRERQPGDRGDQAG